MLYTITDVGIAAVARAQSGGPKITITTYKLGAAAAYLPDHTQTALKGTIVDSGSIANYTVSSANEVQYVINLDETKGDFSFGEVGIYLSTGELFAVASLTSAQPKIKSTTSSSGNFISLNPKLVLSGVAAVISFPITQISAAQYLEVASVDLLAPPNASNCNAYICHNNDDGGNPVLAFKNTDLRWAFSTHPTRIVSGAVTDFALATPAAPTLVGAAGSLPAGTYSYRIASLNALGTTLASASSTITISASGGVYIAWTPVPAATGYKIYGRAGGVEALLYSLDGNTFQVIDTGSATPLGAVPTANTTGTSTTSRLVSDSIGSLINNVQAGKYILQFTSGPMQGYCRTIASADLNSVTFTNFLGSTPATGTTFEIYKSTYSVNTETPLATAPGATANPSPTPNTLSLGVSSFVMGTPLAYTPGMFLMFIPVAAPTQWMWGKVTAWNPTTRTVYVNFTKVNGTGTYNQWTCTITGPEGIQGPAGISSGNLLARSTDQVLGYLADKFGVRGGALVANVENAGGNESITVAHASSGATPGTYRRVQIDSNGHVVAADNPVLDLTSSTGKIQVPQIATTGSPSFLTFLCGDAIWRGAELWKNQPGYLVGMSGYDIDFFNSGGTYKSALRNAATASRTYLFQDKSGTVAHIDDITLRAARDSLATGLASSGTITLDLSMFTTFALTLQGDATLALANVPSLTNETFTFTVQLGNGSVARNLTWFPGIYWITTNQVPPQTPAANKITEFIFTVQPGGGILGRKGANT